MLKLLSRIDLFLGRLLMRTIGLVFLTGALFSGYHGGSQLLTAYRAKDWPTVEGRVIESRLQGRAPLVTYEYQAEGRSHRSSMVHVGQFSGIESYAEPIVESYREGAAVKVYFDPAEPSRSVLELLQTILESE